MLQQAAEQRVQIPVVVNAVHVMALGHPLDLMDQQCDGEWLVRQDGFGDVFRRTDHRAGHAETGLKLDAEAYEQMDVLGLLTGELQQSCRC
jgi:hypothetical protein